MKRPKVKDFYLRGITIGGISHRKFSDQPLLTNETLATGSARTFKDINFGRYYALIIGNQGLHLFRAFALAYF